MFLLYLAFIILCCFITYKIICYQFIKLNNINIEEFKTQSKYIGTALDEIAQIKADVIKIKKDIYQ